MDQVWSLNGYGWVVKKSFDSGLSSRFGVEERQFTSYRFRQNILNCLIVCFLRGKQICVGAGYLVSTLA